MINSTVYKNDTCKTEKEITASVEEYDYYFKSQEIATYFDPTTYQTNGT